MASIFEKDPHFFLERTWDDKTKLPEKQKFSGDNGKKAKVHFNSGSLGIEFFYEMTLPDFIHAGNELQWNLFKTFSKFETVLAGGYKTVWREVVRDHFTPLPEGATDKQLENSFFGAINRFICSILDSNAP